MSSQATPRTHEKNKPSGAGTSQSSDPSVYPHSEAPASPRQAARSTRGPCEDAAAGEGGEGFCSQGVAPGHCEPELASPFFPQSRRARGADGAAPPPPPLTPPRRGWVPAVASLAPPRSLAVPGSGCRSTLHAPAPRPPSLPGPRAFPLLVSKRHWSLPRGRQPHGARARRHPCDLVLTWRQGPVSKAGRVLGCRVSGPECVSGRDTVRPLAPIPGRLSDHRGARGPLGRVPRPLCGPPKQREHPPQQRAPRTPPEPSRAGWPLRARVFPGDGQGSPRWAPRPARAAGPPCYCLHTRPP